MKKLIYSVDAYGIDNYRLWFKIFIAVAVLYTYITLMAFPLVTVEAAAGGNIKTYSDAYWVLQMAASTIGFGDFYPITQEGRNIIALSFYVGVGLAGYIGGSIATAFTSFTDTSVENKELRAQNAAILEALNSIKGKK